MRCRSRSVVAAGHGDGVLGGRRRRILLKDGLDLHVGTRHGELVVLDGHAAADDLPLLEVVALVGRGGQGDHRTGRSGGRSCGAGAFSVIADGDGVGGGGNNAVFPQRLDFGIPAHGVEISHLVLRAADLPSLELLIGGSGEAAGGQDVICLCLDDHGTHAAAAAVAVEGDCAIRKRRTLTHSDFRIGAGKVVVILSIADEVMTSGQVLNLRAAARRIAAFGFHTVFHLVSHAGDLAVAAALGSGRDTDQAVRRFLRGFADAPRRGHGVGAAVRPFAGLGCDANGVIARVRGGVAGDVHCGGIIAAHGCGMLGAIVGVGSGDTDAGLGGIGRRRRVLLEDSLDLHVGARHGELIVFDSHIAAHDLPLLEAVAFVRLGGQGDLRAGNSLCGRCRSHSVAAAGHGDGVLGGRGFGYRNRQLLRIAARAVSSLDGEGGGSFRSRRAADLACIPSQAQTRGKIATVNAPCDGCSAGGGEGLAVCLAHLAVRQGVRGDGGRGGSAFADGEVVLRLAAVVPRAVQRHLGGFFRVKARVVRFEGVGVDVVGIDGGVVHVLRKLLRFVLARLMGKPRQLLFAAVIDAVRQPLHRQKPMLIAVSKIILAAERAFSVFVKAMLNARSVDGAAADGDVFRRNTGQLLFVQVVIDIVCALHFRKPEGVHRAVQDLDPDHRITAARVFPDAGNIVAITP